MPRKRRKTRVRHSRARMNAKNPETAFHRAWRTMKTRSRMPQKPITAQSSFDKAESAVRMNAPFARVSAETFSIVDRTTSFSFSRSTSWMYDPAANASRRTTDVETTERDSQPGAPSPCAFFSLITAVTCPLMPFSRQATLVPVPRQERGTLAVVDTLFALW